MKKRSKVILAASALMLAACALAAGIGKVELTAADLSRRTATVAWTWTDLSDNAVRLSLSRNGEDFPTADWGGTLFIGDGSLGCAVPGTPSGYNELLFDVGRWNLPTNGRYAVQIIATNTAGRVEEWVRGTLTVRANPAADGMPTNWSAYADIARRVAPYIDAQGMLSDPANAYALWGAVSNRTDALIAATAPAPGNYAAVSNAAMTAVHDANYSTVSNAAKRAVQQGSDYSDEYTYEGFRVYLGNFNNDPSYPKSFIFQYAKDENIVYFPATRYGGSTVAYTEDIYEAVSNTFLFGVWDGFYFISDRALQLNDAFITLDNTGTGGGVLNITYDSINNSAGDYALWDDIMFAANQIAGTENGLDDYATHAQATNAARAVSAPLEENVGVLWQFVFADSVWLAVTNYMRTVEGVTPSLQLWEVRNGVTNLVYSSREEITNVVNDATAALRAEITNAMPDKAWSKYQSATGAENPQPGAITIVSTPQVMLTGGGEWNRYVNTGGSAVWVLRSNGLTTFGGGSNGSFFAVQDDEGNSQFEIKRTDSYEVDAIASSCGWDQSGNFQVTYKAPASGNQPVLYASTNLTESFTAEENGRINALGITVNWGASGGLWRATIVQDATAPPLFVHAKVLQKGSVIVKHNAPTSLDGGLFLNNVKYRIVPATISGKTVLTLEVAQ